MPKFFKKTLILIIIIAIFLAPFSGGVKINDNGHLAVGVEVNKANAASLEEIFKTSWLKKDSVNSNSAIFSGELKVGEDYKKAANSSSGREGFRLVYDDIGNNNLQGQNNNPGQDIFFIIEKDSKEIKRMPWVEATRKSFETRSLVNPFIVDTKDIIGDVNGALDSNKTYTLHIEIIGNTKIQTAGLTRYDPYISKKVEFTTTDPNPEDPISTNAGYNTNNTPAAYGNGTKAAYNMSCGTGVWFLGGGSLGGCIAGILYVLWEASAWVARLAGSFLDFFVYYSTNDTSYRNVFIEKGWGAIRDIANIFFIIALLYVAIKTILGLNVTDNKKLVGAVIIVALIINFSLFTTKVVIDTSNILAKVFYNNITSKGENKETLEAGTEGQKSISVGMISKYNPQEIISEDSYNENGPGMFIFTTIILLIITLYTAYIFFSVALLFVARVVSLWIAMIFSPLAFISYAVPFEIPEFGHKKWWKNLFENAFLAPVFIFFLYIIVLFLDIGKNIAYGTTSTDPLQKIMGVVIPFVILFMLLRIAKEIAVEFSGEMGAMIQKAGAMVGGVALGAATGGAALALTKTIGARAQNVANDDNLRAQAAGDKEHFAKMGIKDPIIQKKMQLAAQKKLASANKTAARSFDFRQTGLGKGFSKVTGLDLNKGTGFMGVSTEKLKGGQKEHDKKTTEKEEAKIESYKLTPSAANKQNKDAEDWKENYEKIKNRAKEEASIRGLKYNEKDFKKDYESGEDLYKYGMFGETGSKEIKNATKMNEDRRKAYANSKYDKNEEAKDAVKTFYSEFKKGAGISTGKGIAATIVAGLATGGVTLAAQVAAGLARGGVQGGRAGAANLMDKTIAKRMNDPRLPLGSTFLKSLRDTLRPYATSPEIVAKIRKEDPNKEFKKILSDIAAGKHVSEENKGKAAKEIKDHSSGGSTKEATTPPAPTTNH